MILGIECEASFADYRQEIYLIMSSIEREVGSTKCRLKMCLTVPKVE